MKLVLGNAVLINYFVAIRDVLSFNVGMVQFKVQCGFRYQSGI